MTQQSDFHAALLDADRPVPAGLRDPEGRPAGKRFDVYRNNVAVSLTRALETGFPVLRKLVGDEFFTAMAGVYLRSHPPGSPLLQLYGQAMPAFLRGFAPAKTLPYLADIARVELAVRHAYHAWDVEPFDPASLNTLGSAGLNAARFGFAPASALIRSPHPIWGIWRRNTETDAPKPQARAENILITRPEYDPVLTPLSPPQAVFVAALMEGQSLSQALLRAGAVPGSFDLIQTLGLLFSTAALANLLT